MTRQELINLIHARRSFLCVGLDVDKNKMPAHLRDAADGVFQFNKAIIDATIDYTVAYKPNLAFYEAMGIEGLVQLKKTMDYLHSLDKPAFTIADAKRGDIGNTAARYAKAFFDNMPCDAVTLAPYMGRDSIAPFLEYKGKWAVVLGLTSNASAADFELDGDLYKKVIGTAMEWGTPDNMMFVAGATRPEMLAGIREICPDHFLLVPGVGAQGGSVAEVAKYGLNSKCGLLINSSRGIIYASSGSDFAEAAASAAGSLRQQMANIFE